MINENSAARETQRNLEAEILDSLRKADGSKILDDEVNFEIPAYKILKFPLISS